MKNNNQNYNSAPNSTNDYLPDDQSDTERSLDEDDYLEEITERAADEEESQSIISFFNNNNKKLTKYKSKDLISSLNRIIKYRNKIYYYFIYWRRALNTKFETSYSPKNLKRRKIIPNKYKKNNIQTNFENFLDIPNINIYNIKKKLLPKLTNEVKNNLASFVLFKKSKKEVMQKYFNKWIYSISFSTEKKLPKINQSKNYRNYLFKLYQKMPRIKTKYDSEGKVNKTISYRTKEEDFYKDNNDLNQKLINLIKKFEYGEKRLAFLRWKKSQKNPNVSSEIFVYEGSEAYNNIEKPGESFEKNVAKNQTKNHLRNKYSNNYSKIHKKNHRSDKHFYKDVNNSYDEEIFKKMLPINNKKVTIKKLNFDLLNRDNQKFPNSSRVYCKGNSNINQDDKLIILHPCEIIEENIITDTPRKKKFCTDKKMNIFRKKSKNFKKFEKLSSLINIKNKQILQILSFYFKKWKKNINNARTFIIPKKIKKRLKIYGSQNTSSKNIKHHKTKSEISNIPSINLFDQKFSNMEIISHTLEDFGSINYLKTISNNIIINNTIDDDDKFGSVINHRKTKQIFTRVFHKIRNKSIKKKQNKKLNYQAGVYRLISIINNYKEKIFDNERELQKYFLKWCIISFPNGVEKFQKIKVKQVKKENRENIKIMKKYLRKWYNITFYNENNPEINGKEKELEGESLVPLTNKKNNINGKVKLHIITKPLLIKVRKHTFKKPNNKNKIILLSEIMKKIDEKLYPENEEKSENNDINNYLNHNSFFDNIKDLKISIHKNTKTITKHNSSTNIKKNSIENILMNKIEDQSENGLSKTIQNIKYDNIFTIYNKLKNNNKNNYSQIEKISTDNNKIIMNNLNSIKKSNKNNLTFPCMDKYSDLLRKNYLSMVAYKIYSLYYLLNENGNGYYLIKDFFHRWKKKNETNIKCVESIVQNENGH